MQTQLYIWLLSERFLKLDKIYDCTSHSMVLVMVSSFLSSSFASMFSQGKCYLYLFKTEFIFFLILIKKNKKKQFGMSVHMYQKHFQNFNRYHHGIKTHNIMNFDMISPLLICTENYFIFNSNCS